MNRGGQARRLCRGVSQPRGDGLKVVSMGVPERTVTYQASIRGRTGDCHADGDVSVDELLTGVNIVLGTAGIAECPALDSSADGTVTIDELLVAVTATRRGCAVSP